METSNASYNFSASTTNATLLPVSAFSAYNLLRNCNYLLAPPPAPVPDIPNKTLPLSRLTTDCTSIHPQIPDDIPPCLENDKTLRHLPTKSFLTPPLFGYSHPLHVLQNDHLNTRHSTVISPCSPMYATNFRRPRGEKKPIPDDQKDEKYFERRRRNNQAAKKSRDARKMREDQIALRATILEHENAILRAQILTLREETASLRQMLLQKKTLELSTPTTDTTQICRS